MMITTTTKQTRQYKSIHFLWEASFRWEVVWLFWVAVGCYTWCISWAQSNNTAAHKMVSHNALQNRCLHTTILVGAKHSYSTTTTSSYMIYPS